jgi:hypothetical protein
MALSAPSIDHSKACWLISSFHEALASEMRDRVLLLVSLLDPGARVLKRGSDFFVQRSRKPVSARLAANDFADWRPRWRLPILNNDRKRAHRLRIARPRSE